MAWFKRCKHDYQIIDSYVNVWFRTRHVIVKCSKCGKIKHITEA